MWKTYIMFLLVVFGVTSCKHSHPEASVELKKAFQIQQSALQLNNEIDARLLKSDMTVPSELQEKKAQWLKDMVEIPGMDHDHAECNHDHKRATFSITDQEMIQVQQSWLDSLLVIKQKIDIIN